MMKNTTTPTPAAGSSKSGPPAASAAQKPEVPARPPQKAPTPTPSVAKAGELDAVDRASRDAMPAGDPPPTTPVNLVRTDRRH